MADPATDNMVNDLLDAATFLNSLADKLDSWASESRTDGWSTHQVTANREAANDCRRKAAEIRRSIGA